MLQRESRGPLGLREAPWVANAIRSATSCSSVTSPPRVNLTRIEFVHKSAEREHSFRRMSSGTPSIDLMPRSRRSGFSTVV